MSEERTETEPTKFGTFGGVFTPSILTILGVILFLRAGFVVGEAGILDAMLILGASEVIVILSALSIAAIATNTTVKGGGAYFLISRVLGPEFGGAIGLTLFLAQALSVPFYVLGFTEALTGTVPGAAEHSMLIAMGAAVVLFAVNWVGAAWAVKAQYLILAFLVVSLVSLLGGAAVRFDPETFRANLAPAQPSSGLGFWGLFAIYFPAVTGILAGVNMSGDLKDPARSLVRGTFAAIAVGGVIYLAQIIFCGGATPRERLVEEPYGTLLENALMGTWFLVSGGVFAATLSSAVGSYLGAPRVLQALSRDRIFSVLGAFARGAGRSGEPRRALLLTLGITLGVILVASTGGGGDAFNLVASIVTMFFLLTYGIVNLAAFVESIGSNPSFRPRFRLFHWSTALLGALCCLGAMVLVDRMAAAAATAIIAILYFGIRRRVVRTAFGDARRGYVYAAVAKNLRRLLGMAMHPKNWRPSLLVLSGHPEKRLALVRFGCWLGVERGIVSLVHLVQGRLGELIERRSGALAALRKFAVKYDLNVFPEVVVTEDFDEGVRLTLQAHSLDPIKPNLVLMGWPRDEERIASFGHHLRDISRLGRSALVLIDREGVPESPYGGGGRIDIWWRGRANGSLMVILAHLLTLNWEWQRAGIRLLRMIDQEAGRVPAGDALRELVREARVKAEVSVVVSQESFADVVYQHSRGASVVFLGIRVPEEEEEFRAVYDRMETFTSGLPRVLLVASSGDADLLA